MENIKTFICVIFFAVASVGYSQNSSILSDELYLKYEAAYTDYSNKTAKTVKELDNATVEFYKKFTDKTIQSFNKSKDKMKWFKKNVDKTSFENEQQAIALYTSIKSYEDLIANTGKELNIMLQELIVKYDKDLIYQTLRTRLQE